MSERLDLWLVEKGFAPTRSKAKDFIDRGLVKINGSVASKVAYMVKNSDQVEVEVDHYVSRSAHKLIKALDHFKISVTGLTCVDVGASTGGFTQVLLERGAAKVYAIDVGHDQLAEKLKNDSRVINMEGTNIKDATLPEEMNLAVVDVSFISLIKVLPSIQKLLKTKNCPIIVLVKPQFEGSPKDLDKGIVKDEQTLNLILENFSQSLNSLNLKSAGLIPSPFLGKDGNQEFLTLIN